MEPPTIDTTLYATVLCTQYNARWRRRHTSLLQSSISNLVLATDLPRLGCENRAKDACVGSHASPLAGTSFLPPYCAVNYSKPQASPLLLHVRSLSYQAYLDLGTSLKSLPTPISLIFPSRRLATPSVVSSYFPHIPAFPGEISLFWLRGRCTDD